MARCATYPDSRPKLASFLCALKDDLYTGYRRVLEGPSPCGLLDNIHSIAQLLPHPRSFVPWPELGALPYRSPYGIKTGWRCYSWVVGDFALGNTYSHRRHGMYVSQYLNSLSRQRYDVFEFGFGDGVAPFAFSSRYRPTAHFLVHGSYKNKRCKFERALHGKGK